MKLKKFVLPMVVGSSLFALSCGEKKESTGDTPAGEEKTALSAAEGAAQDAASNVAEELKKIATPADVEVLAGKLGFAAHLPQSTEGILSFYKLGDSFDRLLNTELGQLIQEIARDSGTDIQSELQGQEAQMARAAVGEEVFVAFGAGAGTQGANLTALNRLYNYGTGRFLASMISEAAKGGDSGFEAINARMMMMFSGITKDPTAAIEIFEKSELPPITVGIKVSKKEMRDGFAAMIAGQFANALRDKEAPLEEIKTEKHGVQLTGFKISGKKAAAMVDEKDRKEGERFFGSAENVARFFKAVATKDIVITTGVRGDYILVYAGASLDGFQLVDKAADSVVAHKEMGFMANYTGKDIRLLTFAPKHAIQPMAKNAEAFASLAIGVKDGLAASDSLGDTRDVQRLLDHAAKLDKEIFGSYKYERYGAVGFLEDGFKIESHGGSNQPSIDFSQNHDFAPAGDLKGVALFMNTVGDEKFANKITEMIETVGEAAYIMARRVSELDIDDHDFKEFKEGFGMVDSMLSKDLLELWKALSGDLGSGLGNEGAIVVDLQGSMPKVPGVPSVFIKEAKIPRIAYAAKVKDRAKIGQSWDRLNASLTNILENVQKMGAPPIPMQEPFKSDDNGLSSYFFPIPSFTQNAMPSVSVNDEFFFVSTSPKFAGELAKSAKAGGKKRKGNFAKLDFKAVHSYAADWLELVKNNQDEIFEGNEFAKGDFAENLPIIMKVLKASEELEDVTYHSRHSGGEVRGSFHFNMK